MPNTIKSIVVKDYSKIREERLANAALYPGHILTLNSSNKVLKHATADGLAKPLMVALEDELQGNGINDAYAADDVVQVGIFRPGDVVNVLLKDGQTATIGKVLCSAGDGTVQLWSMSGDSSDWLENNAENLVQFAAAPLGIALEALDLSGSSGTESDDLTGEQHIKMMVL